ncbi:MAG: hypothetical protein ACRDRH_10050 [Pseudonocardia sp.]
MTTPRHSDPADRDPHHDQPPTDPLRPDQLRCLCGATADRDGLCRKCRARTLFNHRAIGRRRATRRRLNRPEDRHPRNRRPNR